MRELLAELTQALERGRGCVWCSIVETRGSTPQKAGAAMLVFADGSQAGTLGGGCVEAEVKQRALRVLGSGARPEVLTFNLDDNYGWDDGLICGGRMSMLVDPLAGEPVAYYRRYREAVESGTGCMEAVRIAGPRSGARYLFDAAGTLAGKLAADPPSEALLRHRPDLAARPRPLVREGVAYLPVLPRIRLLIVG